MKNIIKEHSYKNLATLCQIIGIALCSILSIAFHDFALGKDQYEINSTLSWIAFLIGIIVLALSWIFALSADIEIATAKEKEKK